MLVLMRKRKQSIFIGDGIKITIVDISRGDVRIGIDAPDNVPIYRSELVTDEQAKARVSEVIKRRLADLEASNTGTPRQG